MRKYFLFFVSLLFLFSTSSAVEMITRYEKTPVQLGPALTRVLWLLDKGAKVEIGPLEGDFYSVTHEGQKGYIYKRNVSQYVNPGKFQNIATDLKDVFPQNGATKGQVAVINGGQVVSGFEYNCQEDDKFEVYAVSKTILGIVAAKMVEDGIINLDETIDKYWRTLANLDFNTCSAAWRGYLGNESNVRERASDKMLQNPATLRNCLTHSSTIKNGSMIYMIPGDESSEFFCGSIAAKYTRSLFMLNHTYNQLFYPISQGQPGTITYYNPNKEELTRDHALAGYTMQVVAHVTINEYLKEKILNPLEIYGEPAFKEGNSIYYAAGYQTSAKDLAKIIALVANGGEYNGTQILSASSINQLEKVETNLRNQTIAFNYTDAGRFERKGKIEGMHHWYMSGYSKYGLNPQNWHAFVSYDPTTGNGFALTAYGSNCNGDNLYSVISNYVYSD